MEIFDYTDYKPFLTDWMRAGPKKGRGQAQKLARHLKVGSVLISQVLRGDRDFTVEQAYEIADFLSLTELERRYFLLLVQIGRSATVKLRKYFDVQLSELRVKSKDLRHRVTPTAKLSSEAQMTFYSSWRYSAIRLATSVPPLRSIDAISERFGLSRARAKEILDFLVSQGLCLEEKGAYRMGPQSTHLPADSPMITRLHSNWRIRAIDQMERRANEDLFYTSPVSIARKDLPLIRKALISLIESFSQIVKSSPEETLACLNIDWFEISQ